MSESNNQRIAKNTILLYIRMGFSIVVSLYTARIVLESLGVEDYGVYNVVGGFVAMFSLISGSLSSASTRFLTFELGRENQAELKKVFSTSINIHLILAFLILIIAEVAGIWFLNNKMNIPADRLVAANWTFQFSILSFVVSLISVPYNSVIIAHEHMKAFAYISILEVILKLIIVLLLTISPYDKLISYSLLLLVVAIVIRVIYGIYCHYNFEESKYSFVFDKKLFKQMSGFAGWNFIGTSALLLKDQGVNILLNIFAGPAVNAARGISYQVKGAIGGFAHNFMTAINPQITKSYASGDKEYMMTLIHQGARLSYYLLFFLSLPLFVEANTVLDIWLKDVPEHAVNFARLILILTLVDSLSETLVIAMLATGKIKKYQLIVGGIQLLNFPFSYFLLKIGFFPEVTMIVAISLSIVSLFARLYLLRGMINLAFSVFFKQVIINVLLVSVLSIFIPYWVYLSFESGWIRLLFVCMVSVVSTLSAIYFVGCSKRERSWINKKIQTVLIR
ncbi:oligosaccharide flippase family protein [uncultured Sunxiuqinia sp.]|uniref:oligosaccharide flippase family protein n=1 Tax=uncultured Sunxiuqinia sp. TaxID=1573825 RepID=UPI002AA8D0F0|nr:oligosaccharide flippase family protein [uncultured Sunxiuqinia sp.]